MRIKLAIVATIGTVAACSEPDASKLTGSVGDGAGAPAPDRQLESAQVPPVIPGAPAAPPPVGPPSPPPAVGTPLAEGIAVTEVGVFQGVGISVWKAGAPVAIRRAQVVAGRDALIRVFVATNTTFKAKLLTAELRLVDAAGVEQVIEDTKTIGAPSSIENLASTFNFEIPGGKLPVGVRYAVAITDPSLAGHRLATSSQARVPADGSVQIVDARSAGALKVKLVPVQYNADGSGRLPDVSAAQVELYRRTLYALYPVAAVDVSVAPPFPWSTAIAASGAGFSNILQAMVALRQQSAAPADVYYVGLFAPAATLSAYCGSTCVTGLSGVLTSPLDTVGRASVALGFTGVLASQTAAHEIGHAHGRPHSPCGGATNPDPAYPYPSGDIGGWGYDLGAKALVSPSSGDVMGYCSPAWISDWTYDALFNRVATVNGAMSMMAERAPTRHRMISVEADGSLQWGESLVLAEPPTNEPRVVQYFDAAGALIGTAIGHFYGYEGLPGGYVLVPESPANAAKIVILDLPAGSARELSTSQ